MSLTLTITDNGDGTGGVATIAGSSGAAVQTFCAPYSSSQAGLAWSLAGSRTGDGTVAVAPGNGFYLWYASTASALSNPVNQNLTSGTQAVHYRCLTAIQSQLKLLSLAGIGNNVNIAWLPSQEKPETYSAPGIGVCPMGREGQPGILTGLDDIEYPCLLGIDDQGYSDLLLQIPQRLGWRQSSFRTFRNQRLPGVPEIILVTVDPSPVIDQQWFRDMKFVSALLLKCRSREVRGFGQ